MGISDDSSISYHVETIAVLDIFSKMFSNLNMHVEPVKFYVQLTIFDYFTNYTQFLVVGSFNYSLLLASLNVLVISMIW